MLVACVAWGELGCQTVLSGATFTVMRERGRDQPKGWRGCFVDRWTSGKEFGRAKRGRTEGPASDTATPTAAEQLAGVGPALQREEGHRCRGTASWWSPGPWPSVLQGPKTQSGPPSSCSGANLGCFLFAHPGQAWPPPSQLASLASCSSSCVWVTTVGQGL